MPETFNAQPNAPITRESNYASMPLVSYFNQFDLVEENRLIGRWPNLGVGPLQWIRLGSGVALSADGELSATGLGGDVVGPAGATDNFVPLYNGPTGLILKNSTINGAWFDQAVTVAAAPRFGGLSVGTATSGASVTIAGGALATSQAAASISAVATGRLVSGGGAGSVAAYHGWFDSQVMELSAGSTATFVSGLTVAARSYTGTNGEGLGFWTRSVERCHVDGAGLFTFAAGVATNALAVNGFAVTVNGAPTLNDWFDQSVKTGASPTFNGLTLTSLSVNGFAVTVNGAPTLDNWFDQSVKTSASPTFDGLTVTNGIQADTIDATSDIDAPAYFVGGNPGIDFSGAITNLTVVKGIVTAAS